MSYTGTLRIEEIRPGRTWRLIDPLRYEVGHRGSGLWIEVPSGFITDGASVPPWARPWLAVWGTYGRAAVVHDYLYRRLRGRDPHEHALTRALADAVFFEAMRPLGTAYWLRWVLWAAVRVGGGSGARPR